MTTVLTKKERLRRIQRELGLTRRARLRLLKLLKRFAAGDLAREDLQERTGLWFGDILALLKLVEVPLPIVRTYGRYNEKQRALYDEIFGGGAS